MFFVQMRTIKYGLQRASINNVQNVSSLSIARGIGSVRLVSERGILQRRVCALALERYASIRMPYAYRCIHIF